MATAAGVFVGVGPGALMDTLGGVAGRGVSVGAGAGESVGSSPQATASTMIAVNARASCFMLRPSFSSSDGRPLRPGWLSHSSERLSGASVYHARWGNVRCEPRSDTRLLLSYTRTSRRKVRSKDILPSMVRLGRSCLCTRDESTSRG